MSTINQSPVPEGVVYSMFIPWVETWVTEEKVRQEMEECGFGTLAKVDFVEVATKRKHSKVYLHFSIVDEDVKAHLDGGKQMKVFYNGTYFWKLMKSNYVHKDRSAPAKKFELTE
tara:strand:- start:68 stop:412 length:345 start_codon:yes stop_codon:yes gene_type:complete